MSHLEVTYPRPDVAVLTLNRPDKLNALNYQLVEELHAALDGIAAGNDCRVVVLTGAGRGFCCWRKVEEIFPAQTRAEKKAGVPVPSY